MTQRQWIAFGGTAVAIGIAAILAPSPEMAVTEYFGHASFDRRGDTAPDFTLPVVDVGRGSKTRRQVALSEFRGKPVVISVWATWCKPCVTELKDLRRSARSHREIQFLGVVYKDSDARVRDFLKERGRLGYPNVQSAGSSFMADYRVTGVPVTYFVDANGHFTRIIVGAVDKAVLDDAIKEDFAGN